jgi:hypothetical protein
MQDLMIKKQRDSPGPGQYSPKNTLSKNGKYNQSSFRNTQTLHFRASERFKTIKSSMPGPGHYSSYSTITKNGNHFISNIKDSGTSYFGVSKRDNAFSKSPDTPGPGWYDMPTELGYIEKNLIQ